MVGLLRVFLFFGDNTSYASSWVTAIAMAPGDQVDVTMKDCLPCRFSRIGPYIEARDAVVFFYQLFLSETN